MLRPTVWASAGAGRFLTMRVYELTLRAHVWVQAGTGACKGLCQGGAGTFPHARVQGWVSVCGAGGGQAGQSPGACKGRGARAGAGSLLPAQGCSSPSLRKAPCEGGRQMRKAGKGRAFPCTLAGSGSLP